MKAERIEQLVLVLILTTVGLAAGAASFTHVHDWTMDNSPEGTPDWFGWANAVISELIPVADLLAIRQRRRTGSPTGYPMFLLLSAAGLSLAAQLGVAVGKVGPSGWLLSAVPALAFIGLSKLVLSGLPAPVAEPAKEPPAELPPTDVEAPLDPWIYSEPAVMPEADVKPAATRHPVRRVRPKVLTNAAKVEAAAAGLGPDAKPAQVAAKAGVSESTARRYMPKKGTGVASPSGVLPAEMLLIA
ncbi:DUF2637 domain-containing protein [Micromonospora cremea]|uniref:DUF2637 domain-containing protein n=1 Tax=Micromonospora cremea TaxID=709881 RepID=A0A1N5YXK2_9ACTN|nr:DUF2637 domain-containing protein [Micromonospora cremea]SIN14319.1 hypothetical protein SAMN04489832_3396 [Micromonospora cremea]